MTVSDDGIIRCHPPCDPQISTKSRSIDNRLRLWRRDCFLLLTSGYREIPPVCTRACSAERNETVMVLPKLVRIKICRVWPYARPMEDTRELLLQETCKRSGSHPSGQQQQQGLGDLAGGRHDRWPITAAHSCGAVDAGQEDRQKIRHVPAHEIFHRDRRL